MELERLASCETTVFENASLMAIGRDIVVFTWNWQRWKSLDCYGAPGKRQRGCRTLYLTLTKALHFERPTEWRENCLDPDSVADSWCGFRRQSFAEAAVMLLKNTPKRADRDSAGIVTERRSLINQLILHFILYSVTSQSDALLCMYLFSLPLATTCGCPRNANKPFIWYLISLPQSV